MPKIAFDILMPTTQVEHLHHRFLELGRVMTSLDDALIEDVSVSSTPPADAAYIEPQLKEIFEQEHNEQTIDEAYGEQWGPSQMVRFLISLTPGKRSLNDIAMLFSRLLTPQADLPQQSVLLESQEAFEAPATFPWTVGVFPN